MLLLFFWLLLFAECHARINLQSVRHAAAVFTLQSTISPGRRLSSHLKFCRSETHRHTVHIRLLLSLFGFSHSPYFSLYLDNPSSAVFLSPQ